MGIAGSSGSGHSYVLMQRAMDALRAQASLVVCTTRTAPWSHLMSILGTRAQVLSHRPPDALPPLLDDQHQLTVVDVSMAAGMGSEMGGAVLTTVVDAFSHALPVTPGSPRVSLWWMDMPWDVRVGILGHHLRDAESRAVAAGFRCAGDDPDLSLQVILEGRL